MATVISNKTFISGERVTPASLNSLGLPTVSVEDNEIITSKIANSAVTADKIASAAITGAAGGGKLAANSITGQTLLADPIASGDEFLVHDISASSLRRVAFGSMQPAGSVIRTEYSQLVGTQTYSSGQTLAGSSTPTVTDGVQLLSIPNLAASTSTNYLIIDVVAQLSSSGATAVVLCLFAGSTLIAMANSQGGNDADQLKILFKYSPASTASISYTVRAATVSGNLQVNRLRTITDYNSAAKQVSSMLIQEIKA